MITSTLKEKLISTSVRQFLNKVEIQFCYTSNCITLTITEKTTFFSYSLWSPSTCPWPSVSSPSFLCLPVLGDSAPDPRVLQTAGVIREADNWAAGSECRAGIPTGDLWEAGAGVGPGHRAGCPEWERRLNSAGRGSRHIIHVAETSKIADVAAVAPHANGLVA